MFGQGVVQPWAMTTPNTSHESSPSSILEREHSQVNSINNVRPSVLVGADDSNQNWCNHFLVRVYWIQDDFLTAVSSDVVVN